jgi:branched-chain amino acid transport system permease protein
VISANVLIFQVLNGLVWGLIFSLIALGLNLIYGLMGVINVAHGSLYMLGAVLAWYLVGYTGNFWLALLVAPLAVAALSIVAERWVLRPVLGKKIVQGLLATTGLLLILDHGVLAAFGGTPQAIPSPLLGSVHLVGITYPLYRFFVVMAGLVAMILLWAFLYRTNYGLWMRAVPQNRELALTVGIPTVRVNTVTVALGGYFAALAGVLVAPIVSVHYQMGFSVLAPAFIVVVVGGLGSLRGAIVVAILEGELRGLLSVFFSPPVAEILALVALTPILIVRPHGLFGAR